MPGGQSNPHLVGFAGDRVSANPASITYSMVTNFLIGGTASSVLCRQNGLQLLVCNVGVAETFTANSDAFVKYKIRPGMRNMRQKSAMTPDEYDAAIDAGKHWLTVLSKEIAMYLDLVNGHRRHLTGRIAYAPPDRSATEPMRRTRYRLD